MPNWNGNPNSYWITGDFFKVWAAENQLKTTDREPEFVWVDVETTGLNATKEVTLEIGIMLTDKVGNICQDGVIDWKVWAEDPIEDKSWSAALECMAPLVRDMHKKSGLLKDLEAARRGPLPELMDPRQVENDAYNWIARRVGSKLPLSGSTPHFDRSFLRVDLPTVEDWFHYRAGVDASAFREVAKKINPSVVASQPKKQERHRPIPDLVDSIRLYRHLLATFLQMDVDTWKEF